MKASMYVDTSNKKDAELLLKQAIIIYREHYPSKKTLEAKIKEIIAERSKEVEPQ